MISINGKTTDDLRAIYDMALGLEHWFPKNNGPFAYGTRLCEETGELVEVLQEFARQQTDVTRHHLIKEIEDVLQIVMGVLRLYDLTADLPSELSTYFSSTAAVASPEKIIAVAIQAGQFADAINHSENQGVKLVKHGHQSSKRLVEQARALISSVAFFIGHYQLLDELQKQIEKDYLYLQEQGHIRPVE